MTAVTSCENQEFTVFRTSSSRVAYLVADQSEEMCLSMKPNLIGHCLEGKQLNGQITEVSGNGLP